jgi:hypothetical protein
MSILEKVEEDPNPRKQRRRWERQMRDAASLYLPA